MGIAQEFKDFINRGNVVDMAVGIIVGSSFVKIVDSLVSYLFNPIIGIVMGGIDLQRFSWVVQEGAVVEYGKFLNSVIDFFIVSMSVFIFVKAFNSFKKRYIPTNAPEVETMKTCPFCCSSIPIAAIRCPRCTSKID